MSEPPPHGARAYARRARAIAAALLLAPLACGAPTANVGTPAAAASARTQGPTSSPASSRAKEAYADVIPVRAEVIVRLRFDQLRATPLGLLALDAARALPFGAWIAKTERACGGGNGVLSSFDDVVVAFIDGEVLVAARTGSEDARALDCARNAIEGTDDTLDGDAALRGADGKTWATLQRGLLLVGPDSLVREARKPHGVRRTTPRALLEIDERVGAALSASIASPDAPVRALEIVARSDAARFDVEADATCTSAEATSELAAMFDTIARLGAQDPALDPAVAAALAEMHGHVRRAHVTATVGVAGGERRDGALIVALIRGVRGYLTRIKTDEARNVLREVSTRLAAKAAMSSRSGAPFPPSTLPVPRKTPRGTPTTTRPEDWNEPAWRAIDFRIELPIYYSYAIVTAPDGRSAVVTARGDLDDDGEESLFEIRVGLSREGKVEIGDIKTTRELE